MFRRRSNDDPASLPPMPMDRVTSVLGTGTNVKGRLSGSGGIRIEGAFEGDIEVRGLLVIGESGRVTSKLIQANIVVIAGIVKGDIHAEKVEIRATGRVWGDVETSAFATEEGAFLQGQITMAEDDLDVPPDAPDITVEVEVEVEEGD